MLFVPQSSMTGRHCVGWMPAQAVYRESLPTGMPIPFAPRSPRPRIRSPSVTTMMRTSLFGQLVRISRNAALVLEGEIQSPRAAENMPELHAPLAHRRGVDDGHHLLDVVHDHPVEEGLLAVLERDQVDELLDVARLAVDVFQHAQHLLLQRGHARREQPAQAQGVTLLFREGGSLVDVRIVQQVDSPFPVHVQMKVETVRHGIPPRRFTRKKRQVLRGVGTPFDIPIRNPNQGGSSLIRVSRISRPALSTSQSGFALRTSP